MALYEPGDRFLIAIMMSTKEGEQAVYSNEYIDFGCRPRVERLENGSLLLHAFATETTIDRLRQAPGVSVSVILNETERGKARQREVGVGDRFDGGRSAPRGLGKKNAAGN